MQPDTIELYAGWMAQAKNLSTSVADDSDNSFGASLTLFGIPVPF